MPLFDKFPVDRDEVADALSKHWGLVLGDVIKESQNHTFHASAPDGTRFAARATPDPDGTKHPRILKEVAFVRFLSEHGLAGACAPVPAARSSGALAAKTPGCTVCVYSWADGTPVDFAAYRWMTDKQLVRAWGAWLARLHAASREFARARPEAAEAVQRWDDIHDGIMRGASIHPDDAAAAGDPDKFGVLHGDCNLSNFHIVEATAAAPLSISVFDWEQVHRGWWEWDVAQASLTVLMLAEGGSLPTGDPVPEADVEGFVEAMIGGYDEAAPAGFQLDRARFDRMFQLRKSFCSRFCKRAAEEGGAPPDMAWFIDYINRWMAKHPASVE